MRTAKVKRKTKETDISCEINIDGTGQNEISTGIGFFDHLRKNYITKKMPPCSNSYKTQ